MQIRLWLIPQPKVTGFAFDIQELSNSILHIRWRMSLCLFISDAIATVLAFILSILVSGQLTNDASISPTVLWVSPTFLATYFIAGLYPSSGMHPSKEFQKIFLSILAISLVLTPLLAFRQLGTEVPTVWIIIMGLLSAALVPGFRWVLRRFAIRLNMWGEPVAIIGYGPVGQQLASYLLENLQFGLRPIVAVTLLSESRDDSPAHLIPQYAAHQNYQDVADLTSIHTGLLVLPEMPENLFNDIIRQGRFNFKRLYLLPYENSFGMFHPKVADINGLIGIEVQQYLAQKHHLIIKRLLDIGLILLSSPIVLPLLGILAVLVLLDTKGRVFFQHERLGKDGKSFKIWKIRTMVTNADQILQEYLAEHPDLQQEWQQLHKLKNDPRITRVGRFLRKTSLDELPQLWNILLGEMSWVGPRPIVSSEIPHYGSSFRVYTRVKPGLTGLWQVSGRNDIGYADRVLLDESYVKNWSLWLDIHILWRTIWVVFKGHGAY